MSEEKRGPGRPPKVEKIACELLRDYWPTDNQLERMKKGSIQEFEPLEAIELIEEGRVRRVK